jgi:hypothetical protein
MFKWFKSLVGKKEKFDEKLFKKQIDEISKGEEEEFSKVKDSKGSSPIENFVVPEHHLGTLAWTVSCWRLTNENKTNKMMLEKDVAKFCRLFLAQEKKREKIKDFNRADVRMLKILSLSCDLKKTDKLIIDNGWTYELAKSFEKEIDYN